MVTGEGFVVEGDRLVGRGLDTFAGERFEKGEILGGVVLVRARLYCVYPRPFVCVMDIFMYLVVERVYVWVGEAAGTKGITLADQSFGGVREVRNHVGDVAARGMCFMEACRRMLRYTFSLVVQEERSSSSANLSSVSWEKESLSALRRLLKVRWGFMGRYINKKHCPVGRG